MSKVTNFLHELLVDLYTGNANARALPGHYGETEQGVAIINRDYCCVLHGYGDDCVIMNTSWKVPSVRAHSYDDQKAVADFILMIKNPERKAIYEGGSLAWSILEDVGLRKKIIKDSDYGSRRWIATILDGATVFELIGSPVRATFTLTRSSVWYNNKRYCTNLGYDGTISALVLNEKESLEWMK